MRRTPLHPPPYAADRASLVRDTDVEIYRAGGPGGQHRNKTDSAVRLVHRPSGVVVISVDTPSQIRNREQAFERLAERVSALNYRPKPRRKTRPTKGSVEQRLEAKRRAGAVKKARRASDLDG